MIISQDAWTMIAKNSGGADATRTLYEEFVLATYGRFDVVLERGEGCRVWSEEGKEFLDFGAGIAVCSLGHCHPEITSAIADQAARLVHTSNLYFTRPQAELAHRLVEIIGTPGKVFFCNSGAEANEGLIKLSRRFGNQSGNRHEVITFENSFHGRTMAGISATGQEKVKIGFEPLLEGFVHVPFGDLDAVRAAVTEQTCAILLEPVQGEGGIHIGNADFLKALRALCDEKNLLLLFDEVQCGLGRTGDWCGWQSVTGDTVTPDGVSWAKGIANGFPLGAFWVREQTGDGKTNLPALFGPGSHGTTYGGNPVACAAALRVLEIIERDQLLEKTRELGAFLREEIRALTSPFIREVRAIGLMIGIELSLDFPPLDQDQRTVSPALALTRQLITDGLLVIPAGDKTIRMLPPLNVQREEIIQAVQLLAAALKQREGAKS